MKYKSIKTIKAAFKKMKLPEDFVPDVSMWPEEMRSHKIIEFQLQMVVCAINEGWTPNWQDSDEYKYYPWWYVGGSGFSMDDVIYDNSATNVGPRIVFRDRSRAAHAAAYFEPLYRELYYGAEVKPEVAPAPAAQTSGGDTVVEDGRILDNLKKRNIIYSTGIADDSRDSKISSILAVLNGTTYGNAKSILSECILILDTHAATNTIQLLQ